MGGRSSDANAVVEAWRDEGLSGDMTQLQLLLTDLGVVRYDMPATISLKLALLRRYWPMFLLNGT